MTGFKLTCSQALAVMSRMEPEVEVKMFHSQGSFYPHGVLTSIRGCHAYAWSPTRLLSQSLQRRKLSMTLCPQRCVPQVAQAFCQALFRVCAHTWVFRLWFATVLLCWPMVLVPRTRTWRVVMIWPLVNIT